MNKNVLVTGAHGFIGRHTARAFAARGDTVTGIGHGSWDLAELARFGLTYWYTADITPESLLTYGGKPDIIVHCAGSGSVPFSMERPYQDFGRTVSNTAAVLEHVRLHSPRTVVVYPSSAAVYGNATRVPIAESDALQPASVYGAHKLMAEQMCRLFATYFDVSVAVVRFFSVYGNGLRKQLLWDACRKFSSGDPTFHGTGGEIRDWLHVDDAASLLVAASEHASSGCPVINGGTGIGMQIAEVVTSVGTALATKREPRFGGVERLGDPSVFVADIDRALALGWRPMTDVERGIREYVAWFEALP